MPKIDKLTLDIDVIGGDKIKTMLELLAKNIGDLPEELAQSILDVADSEFCEIGYENISALGFHHADVCVYIDGEKTGNVQSINRILKRCVLVGGNDFKQSFIYPARARLICEKTGTIICEW
jgi:hypothetical protein